MTTERLQPGNHTVLHKEEEVIYEYVLHEGSFPHEIRLTKPRRMISRANSLEFAISGLGVTYARVIQDSVVSQNRRDAVQ